MCENTFSIPILSIVLIYRFEIDLWAHVYTNSLGFNSSRGQIGQWCLWNCIILFSLHQYTMSLFQYYSSLEIIFYYPASISQRNVKMQNATEKPPPFLPSWTGMYLVNGFIVVWVLIVGFGLGGWASMTNFIRQVDTFGLFAKCYQCPPPVAAKHRWAIASKFLRSFIIHTLFWSIHIYI